MVRATGQRSIFALVPPRIRSASLVATVPTADSVSGPGIGLTDRFNGGGYLLSCLKACVIEVLIRGRTKPRQRNTWMS